jgi:hypothetical protein
LVAKVHAGYLPLQFLRRNTSLSAKGALVLVSNEEKDIVLG